MAEVDDPQSEASSGATTLEEHRGERRTIEERAEDIIREHMTLSMIGSAIPIPLLDLTALTGVQLDMIKQLARLYGIAFDSRAARSFLASLASALAGRTLARLGAASLAKLIPGLGQVAGAAAGIYLNGAFTYATGTVIKSHFAQGLPLDELDTRRIRDEFANLFELGRERAKTLLEKVKAGRKARDADEPGGAAGAPTEGGDSNKESTP